jgi:hypothetical protein
MFGGMKGGFLDSGKQKKKKKKNKKNKKKKQKNVNNSNSSISSTVQADEKHSNSGMSTSESVSSSVPFKPSCLSEIAPSDGSCAMLKLPEELTELIYSWLPAADLCSIEVAARGADASPTNASALSLPSAELWRLETKSRWPLFYDEVLLQAMCGSKPPKIDITDVPPRAMPILEQKIDWKRTYRRILDGLWECQLQVLSREMNTNYEFAMSAYNANVTYDRKTNKYRVLYLPDGRGDIIEFVPDQQLRPIPRGLRDAYSVYCDKSIKLADLKIGMAVEIQWKQQGFHPFGFWFGHILRIEDGDITLRFDHYHEISPVRLCLYIAIVCVQLSSLNSVCVFQLTIYLLTFQSFYCTCTCQLLIL